jgi:hypothetical protein
MPMGMEVTVRLAVGRYRPAGRSGKGTRGGAGWARGRAGPLRANGRGRIEAARGVRAATARRGLPDRSRL